MTEFQELPVQANRQVNLLWTGGWDSTFRLLQALLIEGRVVRPFYVIEPERWSVGRELRAMARIKERLFAAHPEARDSLESTVFVEKVDISPDPELAAAFRRIREKRYFGYQWEYLAQFARQSEVSGLEMCQEFSPMMVPFMKAHARLRVADDGAHEVDGPEEQGDPDMYAVLSQFRYPILHLTKPEMESLASRHGFDQLMHITWFCHCPRANGLPCGTCIPCIATLQRGMSRRLPLRSRLRYHTSVLPRLKRLACKHEGLYWLARRVKQRLVRAA